jgi:hypothetical protein
MRVNAAEHLNWLLTFYLVTSSLMWSFLSTPLNVFLEAMFGQKEEWMKG